MSTPPEPHAAPTEELRDALRAYVSIAMQTLQAVCPEGPPDVIVGSDDWHRDSRGVFRLYDAQEPYWVACLIRHNEQLHSLSPYARVLEALQAVPYARELVDQLVGTASSRFRLDPANIADRIIWDMAHSHGLGFVDEHFAQAFQTLDVDLRRREFTQISLVPLLGLTIASRPVTLSSDLEIDRLTDSEIKLCLRLGILPSDDSGRLRMRLSLPEVAIRLRRSERLCIGERTEQDNLGGMTPYGATANRVAGVLAALRVFKIGTVSTPGILTFADAWPVTGLTQFVFSNPGIFPWHNRYSLAADEVDDFRALWQRLEPAVLRGGALANALRRFSYACERDRPDDALVDYMIAAESLFLSDVGTPDRSEMRYRLSHRAALFIPSDQYSPRQVFVFMRRAYDARSAIVHGGTTPAARLLKSPTEDPMTLFNFAQLAGSMIRQALRKAIFGANEQGQFLADWDNMLFPPSPTIANET